MKDHPLPAPKNSENSLMKNDMLRVGLSIGILTLFISILLLYVVNNLILTHYAPDLKAIVDKVAPLSIANRTDFIPEPVERLQYQVTLLCIPIFIFIVFTLINRKKDFFYKTPLLSLAINIGGILAFIFYAIKLSGHGLAYIPDVTTTYFFSNNLIGIFNPVIMLIFYGLCTYGFIVYNKSTETILKKRIVNVISYFIVSIIILDMILYNVFHLAMAEWGRFMETNAVFYAMSQVYAGKSLLVDINAQYGLYGWILCPLFKVIGLSIFKFGMVMSILNGISFFLLYLGIKKITRNDIISLLAFACLIFWEYWQGRLPFESTPRYYYQYNPIRFFFPALVFFLVVTYFTCAENRRRIFLPLLALSASFAIFWNLDTGLVVYGATFIALLFSTLNLPTLKDILKKCLYFSAWMLGSLVFVIILFLLSTKIRAGVLPDFKHFAEFQNIFYGSGFFMLPMIFFHFWNYPALVYIVCCVYCVSQVKKAAQPETNVLVFLFILGCGLFAYFQGRSYDMTIDGVMYPAIIIIGILCKKLFETIGKDKIRFNENLVLFLIPFLFITDGALSMIYYTPSIHSFAMNNAFPNNPAKEDTLRRRMDFVTDNIPAKDTVVIISQDYDGYFYAQGSYYNPINIPGSSELFFKSDLYTLLDTIRTTRRPIIYDGTRVYHNFDTIVKTLAQYTHIDKETPDHTLVLLKHGGTSQPRMAPPDASTLYYNDYGDFSKFLNTSAVLTLPENFTIEIYASLNENELARNNLMFSNSSKISFFHGIVMVQTGEDETQYTFTYADGSRYCPGVTFKLETSTENHVLIKVRKNIITVYNNDKLCGEADTKSAIKNSNELFFMSTDFAGTVHEIKISKD